MAETAPRAGAPDMPWLAALLSAGSLPALRHALLLRQPAFDPAGLRKLAILGAAGEGERLAAICRERSIAVAAIADDDPGKAGMQIAGIAVSPTRALQALPRDIPIIIASHRVLKAYDRLKTQGFQHVAPFALLQVLDAKTFPPHMFYDGWLEDLWQSSAKIAAMRGVLADEMSLNVLDAVLGFRQTLDPTVLAPIVEWDLYGPNGLLRYSDDEVYVDGGSFDGDTIRLFIDRVQGRFSRVLAFEPDRRTFARLKANFAGEARVQPFNAGLHRQKSVLRFHGDASRGAILSEAGGEEVEVVALDDVLGQDRVTYIKMNIEGAEIDALKGAEGSVRRWAPKLAISVYHRPSDLWQIADVVRSLRPDYDLYLRQHDGGVIETVLYALPRANARSAA